jgi:hypothetical protein
MNPLMIVSFAMLAAGAPPALPPTPSAPAPAPKTAPSGTPVKEVVVVSGPGPKVVGSFPAEGAQAPAGVLVLKVVFDQPMAADAWSYGPAESRALPNCLDRPRLLPDKRTTVLLCSVAAHENYAVQINPTPRFASADGRSATPSVLHFSTGDVGVRSLHDALSQADLSDADDPIMRWQDSGAGISHSAPAD